MFESDADLHSTEDHIRQLHRTLLRHSDRTVFETVSPFDTPREMEALVAWTRKTLDEEALHPLLVAAVFVVTFLAIRPFQDGNGRLSRVLTTPPAAARGLCLCALCVAGAGDRGQQGSLTTGRCGAPRRPLRTRRPIGIHGSASSCAVSRNRRMGWRCGSTANGSPSAARTNSPTCPAGCSTRCARRTV